MKILVLCLLVIGMFATKSFAGHHPLHVSCKSVTETSFFRMIQNVNLKDNNSRGLKVVFKTVAGGELKAGDVLEFSVNGVPAGTLELKLKRKKNLLVGTANLPITTDDLGFKIRRGDVAAIDAGLSCTLKK